jgi:hypothetical protein
MQALLGIGKLAGSPMLAQIMDNSGIKQVVALENSSIRMEERLT